MLNLLANTLESVLEATKTLLYICLSFGLFEKKMLDTSELPEKDLTHKLSVLMVLTSASRG